MTITYHYEEHEINGRTFFIEQYANKPHFVKFWRYGEKKGDGLGYTAKERLLRKPSMRTLKNL